MTVRPVQGSRTQPVPAAAASPGDRQRPFGADYSKHAFEMNTRLRIDELRMAEVSFLAQ